jgi:type IV pilus assembly protein PilM
LLKASAKSTERVKTLGESDDMYGMGKPSVIGLDIGTFAVRAVELVPGGSRPILTRFGQVTLPPGAVIGGEVVDVHTVGLALTRLWEEAGFRSRDVVIGVTGQRVIIRQAEMPAMSEEELRSGLAFHAQELLPIPVDEAQLDACILDHGAEDAEEPVMHVLLAAAQREVVDAQIAAVKAAGLKATAVDVLPLALLRAFPTAADTPTQAIVSVGAGLTTVIVREAGVPRFVRVLGVGGDDITNAIGVDLGCDADYAEHLKRQAVAAGNVATLTRASALVAEHVRPLVEEIRGSLDFYLAQADVDQIEQLLLTGGGVRTVGLVAGLQGSVSSQVSVVDPLDWIEVGHTGLNPDDLHRAGPVMAPAIGLAVAGLYGPSESLLRVNLIPTEILAGRRQRRTAMMAGAGVAALAVGLAGLAGVQRIDVMSKRHAADVAETHVTELQGELTKLAPVSTAQADVRTRQQAVTAALSEDVDFPRLIQQVTAAMPQDVWLTSFSAIKGSKGSPSTVSFGASGLSEDAVTRWVRQVGSLPSLANLWVPSTTKADGPNVVVVFSSTANLTAAANSNRAATYTGAVK